MATATTKKGSVQYDLRCASWNIHRAKGADGRVDPSRVHEAISELFVPEDLHILALQEADEECRPHGRILNVGAISEATGLHYQHECITMRWSAESDGFLGTILFLHPRFDVEFRDIIDLPGHCHRGAVIVEATDGDLRFRMISAHLSLAQPLRIVQMRIIGQYLHRRPEMQTVLLGDFNEWRPWGGLMFSPTLIGRRFYGPARRTFPAGYPLLPLDRIMSDRKDAVRDVKVIAAPMARAASDHLPIRGNVTIARSD